MGRKMKAALLAATAMVFLSTVSFAQSWCGPRSTYYYHFDGSYAPYRYQPCHGWEGMGHVFGTHSMVWNQAGRDGVQNYVRSKRLVCSRGGCVWVSNNYQYTHDLRDMNNNLHATGGYWTNLPRPYFDFEDDNGNDEREEAEVTVEDDSFPVVNRSYGLFFWYRWRGPSGGTGNIYVTPAISKPGAFYPVFGDKWDTHRYDSDPIRQHYSRSGNLFEEDPMSELPSEELLTAMMEDPPEERKDERIILPQPISIDDFVGRTVAAGIAVKRFAMEYDVETEDGLQIITVGLAPNENELIPSMELQNIMSTWPVTYKIVGFRGIVSYEPMTADEKAES